MYWNFLPLQKMHSLLTWKTLSQRYARGMLLDQSVFTSELLPHLRKPLMGFLHWKDAYGKNRKKLVLYLKILQILKISNLMDFYETYSLLNSYNISCINNLSFILFIQFLVLLFYGFNSWWEFCVFIYSFS